MIVIDFLTLPSHLSMVWYQYYHKLISFIIFNDNTGTKDSKEYWDDVRSLFSKINSEEKRQYLYLIFLSSVHCPPPISSTKSGTLARVRQEMDKFASGCKLWLWYFWNHSRHCFQAFVHHPLWSQCPSHPLVLVMIIG